MINADALMPCNRQDEYQALAARLATFEKIMEAVYADRDRLREACRTVLHPLKLAAQEMNSGYYERHHDDLADALRQSEEAKP